VDDETRPVSAAVRPTVQLLTAPSGFTLTACVVLAVTIGRQRLAATGAPPPLRPPGIVRGTPTSARTASCRGCPRCTGS
jgi:hypothetical protein